MDAADWDHIKRLVQEGALQDAIGYLEGGLGALPDPHFKSLLQLQFTNPPADIARNLEAFAAACSKKFPLRAIYLEMNGFDINPERWFFDCLGYQTYVDDPDDLEWLGEADGVEWQETTLLGMESLQREFDWYSNLGGNESRAAKIASSYACPLVMCRFADLIGRAVALTSPRLPVPLLATAHDFDFVARTFPTP